MANLSYFNTVNRVLQRHGQTPIPDTTTFDSGTLTKTQLQAKIDVDEAHRMIVNDLPAEFLKRTTTFTTTGTGGGGVPVLADNNTGWALAVPFEDVVPRTFFIKSPSASARELDVKPFNQFRRERPAGPTSLGVPSYVVPLTETALGAADYVAFDPPPNAIYTIEYQYFLSPVALTLAADVIYIPTRFEPVLWEAAGDFLEIQLGDGKAPEWAQFMLPYLTKIRQKTLGLSQLPPACEMGFSIQGIQRENRSTWCP